LVLLSKKCIFEHYREVPTIKNILIDIIFVMNFVSGDLLRPAPFSLLLVLHKDELFHYPLIKFSMFIKLLPALRVSSGGCGNDINPVTRI
jgi:hypothetical protein